ncbi:MAG: HAMP domain-containing sensor histidine kinase [Candidatus Methylomirabilota bacterium]|jgi:signal transduction histidine kinase
MRPLGSKLPLWLRLAPAVLFVLAGGAVVSALIGASLGISTQLILALLAVMAVGVAATLGSLFLTTRGLTNSLRQLTAAADAIAHGDLGRRVNVAGGDEAGRLAASLNEMVASLHARAQRLEEEELKHTEELMHLQSRMAHSEKLASMGRLAAGVAHELNTPLGGVLSLAMLALEECDQSHPVRKDLEVIVKQALHCREIVKGLLAFAHQSESGAAKTDVNSVIESTLALLERQAIFQNVRTRRTLGEGLPPVFIDPSRLQSVIMNVVMNAVDAMEGTGALGVETAVDEAGEQVLIRISDTGKGIPDKIKPLIFEPFFTTKEPGEGTGLGLAIVYGVVKGAGGRISVDSSPSGTTFTIWLPIMRQGGTEGDVQSTAQGGV